jgi:hypothetical protein
MKGRLNEEGRLAEAAIPLAKLFENDGEMVIISATLVVALLPNLPKGRTETALIRRPGVAQGAS